MNSLCTFSLCKRQVISILGLAPYYIASRIFAKIKNRAFAKIKKTLAYRTMHTEPPVVPSAHFTWCGFLAATDYALKRLKALKDGILPQ